jgi:hypothetical protein
LKKKKQKNFIHACGLDTVADRPTLPGAAGNNPAPPPDLTSRDGLMGFARPPTEIAPSTEGHRPSRQHG